MNKDEILNAYYFRHACKDFDTSRTIPAEDFDFILETGRLSPSSFGFEPWEFLVVQNPELREKLREFSWGGQNQIPHSSHLVVYLAKKKPIMCYDSNYVKSFMTDIQCLPEEIVEMKSNRYELFQKEDFKLLDDDRAMFDWACKQVYIALANMMTAAAMIGVDSCPIEGFAASRLEEVLQNDFGYDTAQYGVAVMCAFGYRVKDPRPKTRQPMEKIVRWFK